MTDPRKAKFDKLIAKAKAETTEPMTSKLIDLLEAIGNAVHEEEVEGKKQAYEPISSFGEIPDRVRDTTITNALIYCVLMELKTEGYRLSLDKFNEFMGNDKKISLRVRDEDATFEITDMEDLCEDCGLLHD